MFVSVTFKGLNPRLSPYTPIFNSEWESWRYSAIERPETADEIATFLVNKAKDRFECGAKDLKVIAGHKEPFR